MGKELPKILMPYRATPHTVSGKSPTMLLFNREIRMKVPRVESNQTSQNDEVRSRCHKYQEPMKDYHDKKNNATPHNFKSAISYFAQT